MKYRSYEKVTSMDALKKRIQNDPEHILPVAGGTDLMVKARSRDWYQAMDLVDITGIAGLKTISGAGDRLIIGALVTADELLRSKVIRASAPILASACEVLAGPQIRNRATIGGNLANACLAGDMIPPLCVLQASVHTVSAEGEREIPVENLLRSCPACLNHEEMSVGGCFYGIPAGKKTILAPGEIITSVTVPMLSEKYRISFQKIGRKQVGCMSKFTLAAAMCVEDGIITDLRMSIGAAFSNISLLTEAYEKAVGKKGSTELFETIAGYLGDCIEAQLKNPNESVRYKAEVCRRLTARTLMELYRGECL